VAVGGDDAEAARVRTVVTPDLTAPRSSRPTPSGVGLPGIHAPSDLVDHPQVPSLFRRHCLVERDAPAWAPSSAATRPPGRRPRRSHAPTRTAALTAAHRTADEQDRELLTPLPAGRRVCPRRCGRHQRARDGAPAAGRARPGQGVTRRSRRRCRDAWRGVRPRRRPRRRPGCSAPRVPPTNTVSPGSNPVARCGRRRWRGMPREGTFQGSCLCARAWTSPCRCCLPNNDGIAIRPDGATRTNATAAVGGGAGTRRAGQGGSRPGSARPDRAHSGTQAALPGEPGGLFEPSGTSDAGREVVSGTCRRQADRLTVQAGRRGFAEPVALHVRISRRAAIWFPRSFLWTGSTRSPRRRCGRRGDAASASAFVRAHPDRCVAAVRAPLRRDSADDLTQETYARAFASLPSFRRALVGPHLVALDRPAVCADAVAGVRSLRSVTPVERYAARSGRVGDPAGRCSTRWIANGARRSC